MPQSLLTTPIGIVALRSDGERLTSIVLGTDDPRHAPDALTAEAAAQMAAWFAGRLTRFDLPLAPAATPRGRVLRAALEAIGHGETATYGEVARAIGSGARAVGQACARNPFPIVVPCHRILAAGGAIGHYSAGGGIATKRRLLDHERRRDRT